MSLSHVSMLLCACEIECFSSPVHLPVELLQISPFLRYVGFKQALQDVYKGNGLSRIVAIGLPVASVWAKYRRHVYKCTLHRNQQ